MGGKVMNRLDSYKDIDLCLKNSGFKVFKGFVLSFFLKVVCFSWIGFLVSEVHPVPRGWNSSSGIQGPMWPRDSLKEKQPRHCPVPVTPLKDLKSTFWDILGNSIDGPLHNFGGEDAYIGEKKQSIYIHLP